MEKQPRENVKFKEISVRFFKWNIPTLRFKYVDLLRIYKKSSYFKRGQFGLFRKNYSSRLTRKFLDVLIKEMIYNDAVFMFPNDEAFMVIAQQSILTENVTINMDGRTPVRPYFYFNTKEDRARSRWKVTMIYFAPQYYKLLNKEIEKGHVYPSIDEVLNHIQNGKYSGKQPLHASRKHFDRIAKAV